MGAVAYMSLYEVVSRRLYPLRGVFEGVALQPEPVLGPEIARATTSAIWAQNRRGLQGNPIQIPQVMDTAA